MHFPPQSREQSAALFLLDPRPLEEKKPDLQKQPFAGQASFAQFLIAEHHLKNNNTSAAIESYNRCLELGRDTSEFDDWFKNRAKRKLDQLINSKATPESGPDITGG